MSNRRNGSRRFTRREFLAVGTAAGAGLALSGCGGGPQNNPALQGQSNAANLGKNYDGPMVELAFWNGLTGGDGPYMLEMVEQFNREHDNIKVKMTASEWAEYYQKLPSAVSVGQGPEIGIMEIHYLATNAVRNVIMPLDDVLEALGYREDDFPSNFWQSGFYDGQQYGVPLGMYLFGLYYNKRVMERGGLNPDAPPTTGEEYIAALEQLKENGVQGSWITAHHPQASWYSQSLLAQFGAELFDGDFARATFNSDAAVEAMTWATGLIEAGYSPRDGGQDSEFIAFRNDENAFVWVGPWVINQMKGTDGLEFGVAPLPVIGSQRGTWGGSHTFVLTTQARQDDNKLQASAAFIDWILQHSIDWARAGQVPALESVRQSRDFQDLEMQATFAEALPYARYLPAEPGINDVLTNTFDPAINNILLLREDPKSALDEAAGRADKLLEDNRQKYGG